MKSKKFAVLLLTLVLALGLLPMGVFAATPVASTSTASITVKDAVPNDVLAAYKLLDITYTAETNTLSHAWASTTIQDYFENRTTNGTGTAYTVATFSKLGDDSDDLNALLARLPQYLKDNSVEAVQTQIVGADSKATFTDLPMGEYFILPTSSTSVYQLMLQKVEPTVSAGAYVIDDVTFSAKHKEVSITKTADKTSVTKGENVVYTLEAEIPTYLDTAVDKSFWISDQLPDGLTINESSIAVTIGGETVDAGDYTLDTTPAAGYTFKLSVSTDLYANKWSGRGGNTLTITYTATLNSNNTTEVNVAEINTATYEYSFYPYLTDTRKTKTATEEVTTFAIQIDKHVQGQPVQKLSDAKFDLYRTATAEEIAAGSSVTIPHTTVPVILLESGLTTNASGVATFEKYEANDTRYAYYLVETKAPTGYNLLSNAVEVHFTDAEVAGTNGIYTVEIENTSGIQLPITGGTGAVIFTVIGIALMVGAVVLFVLSRKKSKAKENE